MKHEFFELIKMEKAQHSDERPFKQKKNEKAEGKKMIAGIKERQQIEINRGTGSDEVEEKEKQGKRREIMSDSRERKKSIGKKKKQTIQRKKETKNNIGKTKQEKQRYTTQRKKERRKKNIRRKTKIDDTKKETNKNNI